jgi:membrane associated rhomboid family serine protease
VGARRAGGDARRHNAHGRRVRGALAVPVAAAPPAVSAAARHRLLPSRMSHHYHHHHHHYHYCSSCYHCPVLSSSLRVATTSLQIHRIYTSVFLHNNLLHLVFNLLAWESLGSMLERHMFGSLQFLWLVTLLIGLSGLLTVILSNLLGVCATHVAASLAHICCY